MNIVKRMNYKRKFISYFVITSVFLSSFLFYSPADIVLSAQGDPYIEVTSPIEGAVFDVTTVDFAGNISDDSTSNDQLIFKVFENPESSSEPLDITKDGKLTLIADEKIGKWTFSKEFSEGTHSLTFEVSDGDGKSAKITRTFTIEKTLVTEEQNGNGTIQETSETQVEETSIVDNVPSVENQGARPYIVNMKIIPPGAKVESEYLPAEDMTQVPLGSKILMVIKETGSLTYTKPLIVSSNKGDIQSKEDIEGLAPQRNEDGDYVITFSPVKEFDPSTTYYVYVNPTITNDLGNRIFSKFFKFTTINTNHLNGIHGNYANNTNACAYCHSTHNGETPTLEGGEYGSADADNFCMVCHDGTNGSPMPDKYDSTNKHNQHSADSSGSCTSCHNPHAAWTADNPSRIHRVETNGQLEPLTYEKADSASGKAEDFTLCLSCHNGTKASNIKQYYENEALINESGHNITASDGSALNGQLACADCHETHGSNNLMLLREELGNVKLADTDKFKTTGTAWNAVDERQFCLKCHNNSTEVYGKTSTFKENNPEGEPVPGHQPTELQSCTTCHGGVSQSAIEAAHAPKKGVHVPK